MRLLIPDVVWKRLLYAFIPVGHGVSYMRWYFREGIRTNHFAGEHVCEWDDFESVMVFLSGVWITSHIVRWAGR